MTTIFIGSSTQAAPRARELEAALSNEFVIRAWYGGEVFQAGDNILQDLLKACRECDFAAVFLTPDDETKREGKCLTLPRDNCVFESGLFLGHLGLVDPGRVFLISTVPHRDLLSDLHGIITVDGNKSTSLIAQEIRAQVRRLGEYTRPDGRIAQLTYDQLLIREGKLGDSHRVVVQSVQPLELEQTPGAVAVPGAIPERVRNNMKRGLRYHYYFHANHGTVDNIVNLCRRLATISKDGSPLPSEQAMENWALMADYLRIHFLAKHPLIDFCIHDLLGEHPKLYLRNRDYERFYLWSSEVTAHQSAAAVRTVAERAWQQASVFVLARANSYSTLLKNRCDALLDGASKEVALKSLFG